MKRKNIFALFTIIPVMFCTNPVMALAAETTHGDYTYKSHGEAVLKTVESEAIVDSDDIIESADRLSILEGQTEFLRQGNKFNYNEEKTYYYIESPDGTESKLGAYGNATPENVLKGKTFTSAVSDVGAKGMIHSIGDDILDGDADRLSYFTYEFPRVIEKTVDRNTLNLPGLFDSSSDSYTKTGLYSIDLGLDQYMVIPKGFTNNKIAVNNALYDRTTAGDWTEYITNAESTTLPEGYYNKITFTNELPESNDENDEVWHHVHLSGTAVSGATGSTPDTSMKMSHSRAIPASGDDFGVSDDYVSDTKVGCFQTPVYHRHSLSTTSATSNTPNASDTKSYTRGGCYQKEVRGDFKYNNPHQQSLSFDHSSIYDSFDDVFSAVGGKVGDTGITATCTAPYAAYTVKFSKDDITYKQSNKSDVYISNSTKITLGKKNETDNVSLADQYGVYSGSATSSTKGEWYAAGTGWKTIKSGLTDGLEINAATVVTFRRIYKQRDFSDGITTTTYTNEAALENYSYTDVEGEKYVIDNVYIIFEINSKNTQMTTGSSVFLVSDKTMYEATCGINQTEAKKYVKSCNWHKGQVMKETITLTHTSTSP